MKQKLLLLVLGVLSVLPALARDFMYTYEGVTLKYEVIDEDAKTCWVSDNKSVSGAIVIPSVANDGTTDYSVLEISESAFSGCSGLTSVTIPESVTSIDWFAFKGCSGLTSVVIPKSVILIDSYAFFGCSGLTSVTIPESVAYIGDSPFGNSGLISLTWNAENCTFYGTGNIVFPNTIETLVIGDNVKTIPSYAFQNLKKLTSVTIPESVTYIGDAAFKNSGLISLTWNAENCTSCGTENIVFPNTIENLVIGDNVKTIPSYAFFNLEKLTSVTIPESVTYIGDAAFGNSGLISLTWNAENCTSCGTEYIVFPNTIETLVIGDNVKIIPDFAFYNLEKLTSVVIPNSVMSIGYGAFYNCSGITSVVMGNSVTSIGEYAFYNCSGLTSAVMGNSVQTIGGAAFYGCSGLTSVVMGNSVQTIGGAAFYDCRGLTSLEIPNSVQTIGGSAFSNCSGLTSVVIPNSVTSILDNTFANCSDLTSVVIPISVTSIGDNAFSGCTSLTEVVLPPHVETIGKSAFAGDSNLASIIMGHSVKTIGEKAFDGCKANTVYITTQTPPTAYDNTFSNYSGRLYAQGLAIDTYMLYTSTCWYRFQRFDGMIDAITIMIQDADKISGKAGDTFQLNAYVLPERATLPQIFWRSTNPEIATVDAYGLVTLHVDLESIKTRAVGEGNIDGACTIIAETLYNNGPIAKIDVTAEDNTPILVESLTIDPTAWSGEEGSEFTIKATVLPENAEDKTLTFESSDTSVATVDAEGNVKVLKEGTCVITVSTVDGSDLKAECVVTGLSGVEAIFADPNASVDVYDMNGVMLKKSCSREELKQLKPAVYILRSGNAVVKAVVR